MSTDWAATGAMLAGFGAVINGLAILAVAWVGRKTVQDMRREAMIEKETAFAEQLLGDAYRALDRLSFELSQARGAIQRQNSSIEFSIRHDRDHDLINSQQRAKVLIARRHGRTLLDDRAVLNELFQHNVHARVLFDRMVNHHLQQIAHVWTNGEFQLEQWGELEPASESEEMYQRWLLDGDWEKVLKAAREGLNRHLLPYIRQQ